MLASFSRHYFLWMTFAHCLWRWTVCICLLSGRQMGCQFVKNPLNHSKCCGTCMLLMLGNWAVIEARWWHRFWCSATHLQGGGCRAPVRLPEEVVPSPVRSRRAALRLSGKSMHCISLSIALTMAKRCANPVFNCVTSHTQGSEVEVEVPANICKYMEALFAFTTHPSQVTWHSNRMLSLVTLVHLN